MSRYEGHAYEACDHPGRHGYTQTGEAEYEFCERCRRIRTAHLSELGTDTLVRIMERAGEWENLDDTTAELERRLAAEGKSWSWQYIGGVGHRIIITEEVQA